MKCRSMPPIGSVNWRKLLSLASHGRQSKPVRQYSTMSRMYARLVPVDHGSSGGSSGQRVRARRSRRSVMARQECAA